MFRRATPCDYAKILLIYNQVIDRRTVTADLTPVTLEDRQAWFDFHANNERYPLWVYEVNHEVVAWVSLSPYYGRPAYDGTAEVSFYVDEAMQGKGIGKSCLHFLKSQMSKLGFHTLLGFVFGNNMASLNLLQKCDFKVWGELPKVANMGDHHEDLVILGYSSNLHEVKER